MSKKTSETIVVKNYKKTGIVAAIVIVVAVLGIWAVRSFNSDSGSSVEDAIALVSEEAVSGGDMRIAVVRMDEIQNTATALKNQIGRAHV